MGESVYIRVILTDSPKFALMSLGIMLGSRVFFIGVILCAAVAAGPEEEEATLAEPIICSSTSKLEETELNVIRDLDEDDGLIDEELEQDGSNRNSVCPPFEEYLTCGPTCQITCETLGTACPVGSCQPGCFCKAGRVRSSRGNCISQNKCSSEFSILHNCQHVNSFN